MNFLHNSIKILCGCSRANLKVTVYALPTAMYLFATKSEFLLTRALD